MPRYSMPQDQHQRIFGADQEERATGRTRRCKSCGGWHKVDAWPHNCRPPSYSKQRLASPQIAPKFEPFATGKLDTAEVIGSRNDKREYMKSNDLVEFDEGVTPTVNEWVEARQYQKDIVADIKRFEETDPLNLPPDLKAQRMGDGAALDGAPEVTNDGLELIE